MVNNTHTVSVTDIIYLLNKYRMVKKTLHGVQFDKVFLLIVSDDHVKH